MAVVSPASGLVTRSRSSAGSRWDQELSPGGRRCVVVAWPIDALCRHVAWL